MSAIDKLLNDLLEKEKEEIERSKKRRSTDTDRFAGRYSNPSQTELQRLERDYDPFPKGQPQERDGLLGFLDKTIVPFSKSVNDVFFPGVIEKNAELQQTFGRDLDPVRAAALKKPESFLDKAIRTAGTVAGYGAASVVPYGVMGKAVSKVPQLANLANQGIKGRLGIEAFKGAGVGAQIGTGQAVANEVINPEKYDLPDHLKRIGAETAIGAVADPLIYGAGRAIGKGVKALGERFAPNQVAQPSMNQTPNLQQMESLKPTAKVEDILSSRTNNTISISPRPLPDNVQAMASEPIPLPKPKGDKQFKEMSKLESVLNQIKKATGSKDVYEQPITRRELLENMRKRLGVTIRTGRLGRVDEEVQGFFKVDPEVIRTRRHGNIQVIAHEIGHNLDKRFNLSNPQFDDELMKLGRNTSDSTYTPEQVRNEGLAEYIRLYLTEPETAVQQAPRFSQFFEQSIDKKTMKALQETQADVNKWIEQGDFFRAAGKIDMKGEKETISEKLDKVYSDLIDKYDYAKKVEIDVKGKVSEAQESLYKRLRLSAGAPKVAERYLQDLKRILQPIEKYGYKKKDVSRYIAMKHAQDLEKAGIETGFTKAEIESVLRELDSPELQQVQQQLVQYSNTLLDILVQSGRISRNAVIAMRKKYPNYVPFFRHFEEDMTAGFGNRGFANLTNPVKRIKGSTRDIIDPLESLVRNTFAIINTAEKNKVGLELLRLAEYPGAGKYVEVVPGGKSKKEHVVTVYKDGEPVQLQLDPELHRLIQQMDAETSGIVIQMLSIPAQMLRHGATLTPEFMLGNPIRDQFQTFVVSENGYFPPRDFIIGFWHAVAGRFGKSEWYEKWARAGGGYGNLMSVDRNYLREQLKQLKREGHPLNKGFKTIINPKEWFRLLQALSELSEEATKVGEFRRAIKKGKSVEEAAFESRDLMDFARSGTAIKEWNKVVTFLNANIQGKDKLARAFKQNPARFTIRALTGVTLPAAASYLAMQYLANEQQKETWKNAPEWMKETFFFLPIPGTDVVARIPKPFDLAPIFATPMESFLDYVYQNDPATLQETLINSGMSLAKIPFMLTGVAPLIENWANKSFFTGNPIVPRRDQDVLPEEQYGVSTSLTARTIGKYTNYSPYKIDNLIRGYGAGLGRYATAGTDKLLEATGIGKMPPQEKKKWSELPVLNAFTVDDSGGGKVVDDFYETLEKLRIEYNTARKREEPYEREKDYKYLNKVSREMSELNKQYREVLGSYDMTPMQKRTKLNQLDEMRKALAKEALKKVGKQ